MLLGEGRDEVGEAGGGQEQVHGRRLALVVRRKVLRGNALEIQRRTLADELARMLKYARTLKDLHTRNIHADTHTRNYARTRKSTRTRSYKCALNPGFGFRRTLTSSSQGSALSLCASDPAEPPGDDARAESLPLPLVARLLRVAVMEFLSGIARLRLWRNEAHYWALLGHCESRFQVHTCVLTLYRCVCVCM